MNKKDIMLISPEEVKAQSDLSYNVDDRVIGASIRAAQNIWLRDVIGTEFLEKLQELVMNSIEEIHPDIDDEVAYKTLLDEYITPLLAYKVAAEICDRITLKIRNMGVIQNSDINVNAVSLDDVVYLQAKYEVYYNDACNRLAEFVCQHSDAYPESNFICGCGKSPRYGRTGLWLG